MNRKKYNSFQRVRCQSLCDPFIWFHLYVSIMFWITSTAQGTDGVLVRKTGALDVAEGVKEDGALTQCWRMVTKHLTSEENRKIK